MNDVYLEFLTELYISLERVSPSMWSLWIKKSIDRFNEDKDVTYFLNAFGGLGSFSDSPINDNVVLALKSITYCIAKSIQDKEVTLEDILLKEIERLNHNIINNISLNSDNYYILADIEREKDMLIYITEINDNYVGGNLHEITINFLNGISPNK